LDVLNKRLHGAVNFVQIGANDGIQEDPCYAWINRYPWRGVLVEPQPELAAALRRIHGANERIRVQEAVITDQPGTATLYYLRQGPDLPAWTSGIASLRREAIEGHRQKIPNFDAALASVEVSALSLSQLLDASGLPSLDFLQIDAEGYDFQIIRSIDFDKLRPLVISFEHANLSPEDHAACRTLLAARNYEFASWLGDTVACHREFMLVSGDRRTFLGA
jgi:FkbM family methyltransferase